MDFKNITVTEIAGIMTVYSEKDKHTQITNRKYYGLSFCQEGKITYIQNGGEYVSNPDCAVILPKGGTYFIKREQTGHFPVINFNCSDFLCDTVTVIPLRNAVELIDSFERMKKLSYFEENRLQIFSIFYDILHKCHSDHVPYELKGAIRQIQSNYGNPSLTNANLAAKCNISEVYFRKLFKEYFHLSPKQFIIDIRIQKAKQLLTESTQSISIISEMCGFSNPYHFCRTFKQHTGTTPTIYRKINWTSEI